MPPSGKGNCIANNRRRLRPTIANLGAQHLSEDKLPANARDFYERREGMNTPIERPQQQRQSESRSRGHQRVRVGRWRVAAGIVLMLAGTPLGAYGGILLVAAVALQRAPAASWFALSVLLLLECAGAAMLATGTLLVAGPAKVLGIGAPHADPGAGA